MLIVATLQSLEGLRQTGSIDPELLDYMEPTLAVLEEEYPDRDPELDGGCFVLHQSPEDLRHPTHGLFYTFPDEPDRLPMAEGVEEIVAGGVRFFAVFVATDGDSGNTYLLPDSPWLPPAVREWLLEGTANE